MIVDGRVIYSHEILSKNVVNVNYKGFQALRLPKPSDSRSLDAEISSLLSRLYLFFFSLTGYK
jgi:hypothetical protein